jgi:hypothetical protein
MTSNKKAVRRAVFSSRFVVASMRPKTLANAAYGTLMNSQTKAGSFQIDSRFAVFPSTRQINFVDP